MKTNFKIAWVDDGFTSDPQMQSANDILERRLRRKNSFSLSVDDVYAQSEGGKFDDILKEISDVVHTSNSIDLAMIDYELGQITDKNGDVLTGPIIAKKFRDSLRTVDIVFYSGKKSASELRGILAEANVDCVNCVGRNNFANDTFMVIEQILHRSYKISTLRGLILNSVCEMDHVIIDILCSYYNAASGNVKSSFVDGVVTYLVVRTRPGKRRAEKNRLLGLNLENLLREKNITSGSLFVYLKKIKGKLSLSATQRELFDKYQVEILELRNTAAHAKESMCDDSNQAMLEFGTAKYKNDDINDICKTIVAHENNIQSILDGLV